jgi:hypothetical protein
MPDKSRPFDAPIVPDTVIAQIVKAIKGQRAFVLAALSLEGGDDFIAVRLAVRLDQLL